MTTILLIIFLGSIYFAFKPVKKDPYQEHIERLEEAHKRNEEGFKRFKEEMYSKVTKPGVTDG